MKYVPINNILKKNMRHTLNVEEDNQRIVRTEEHTIYTENKHYEEMKTNPNK